MSLQASIPFLQRVGQRLHVACGSGHGGQVRDLGRQALPFLDQRLAFGVGVHRERRIQ